MTRLMQTTAEPSETDVLYNLGSGARFMGVDSEVMVQFLPSGLFGSFSDIDRKHSENTNIDNGRFLLETINILPKLSKSDTIFSIGLPQSTELHHALDDLSQVAQEAREEEFPLPSSAALTNAEYLLKEMYGILPRRFEIYPTPDGEVAIDAPGEYGRSVLVLCDSEGGALCLVNMNGEHRRARYSTTSILPDGFVREALADLERGDDWG